MAKRKSSKASRSELQPSMPPSEEDLRTVFAWPRLVALAVACFVAYALVFQPWIIDDRYLSYYEHAHQYRQAKRYDKAVRAYQDCLRLRPDYLEAHIMLGNTLADQKKFPEAAACFRAALDHISPATETSLITKIYYNLGNALIRLQLYDDANEAYRQATNANPKHGNSWLGLGMTYEQSGEMEKAIAAYENALKAKPGFAEAQKRLSRLRR